MNPSHRTPWAPAVVLIGGMYALVGIGFAVPTTHVSAWRLAAWVVSAVAFAAHIAYERFRLQHAPVAVALHVAAAAALGAFGLAVGANVHALSVGSTTQHRLLLILALALWPLITALPAFLVALAINAVLARAFRRPHPQEGA